MCFGRAHNDGTGICADSVKLDNAVFKDYKLTNRESLRQLVELEILGEIIYDFKNPVEQRPIDCRIRQG